METSPTPAPSNANTVYSNFTRALGVLTWVVIGLLVLNLVLAGTAESIWSFLPGLLFAAWASYVLLWRPCLKVGADRIEVRNILRDHSIPFTELTALRVIQTVSFDTTAGRIPSWGAPGAGKLGPRRSTGTAGGPTAVSLPATQSAIESAWDAWERHHTNNNTTSDAGSSSATDAGSQPGPVGKVQTRWNVPAVVVGGALAVLVVASVLT